MNQRRVTDPKLDLFTLGEALVDLISNTVANSLEEAATFGRYLGGQPTNLAVNMALLDRQAAIAACVGNDGFGHFVIDQIKSSNVIADHIQLTDEYPTSVAIITRQARTADFLIARGADAHLRSTPTIELAAANSRIVHTSAFGLSREPARSTILGALEIAHEAGNIVSLDPNYHPKNWPDTPEFLALLRMAYRYVSITKPSLDDCVRLFGPGKEPAGYARCFLEWGCRTVALSMGARGILLATASDGFYHIESHEIPVIDSTGAGDAFWAGFLSSFLDGFSVIEAARIGQVVAAVKLGTVGPLKRLPSRKDLQRRAKAIPFAEISDTG